MARKYRFRADKPDCFGWGMNECEERLLIAAYEDVAGRIPDATWKRDFLLNFYDNGKGVIFGDLDRINAVRRRVGLEEVSFIETDIDAYGRLGGQPEERMLKTEKRRAVQQEYLTLDTAERLRWKQQAQLEIGLLQPPHRTLAELEEQEGPMPMKLTTTERAKRNAAVAPPAPDTNSRALRQLRLVKVRPEIVERIVASLSPDAALTLAESPDLADNLELIAALVMRSLDE